MSDEMIGPVSFAVGLLCCGIPAIVGTIALPFVVMRWWFRRQAALADELKATGYPGEALILNIQPTGRKLFGSRGGGGIPRWSVTMDVHLPNIPTYQVTKTLTFSQERAASIPPGTVVTVLANPQEPQKIGIVWDKAILNDLPKRHSP